MRKLLSLVLLILLFLSSCGDEKSVEAGKLEHKILTVDDAVEVEIEKESIPREFAFIQENKVPMSDDEGNLIRDLHLQERVFVYRKKGDQSLIYDQYGNRGWVSKEYLSKRFLQDIVDPQEGAFYGSYTVKDKPYEDYVKVKGIYISPLVINSLDEVLKRVENSPINTLILDYHDDYGRVLFPSQVAEEEVPAANNPVFQDGKALIKELKDKGFHLIARIVTFKSPLYAAQHKDRAIRYEDGTYLVSDGEYWSSPFDRQVWDYVLALSNEALDYGFDEIQYDYVRFPDSYDDDMLALNERNEGRTEVIQKFLMYMQANLNKKDVIIGADVFGWAAIESGDVTIGHHWEAISNVTDVICPMFYPSLYPWNFDGEIEGDPVAQPYKTLQASIRRGLERNANVKTAAIIRPWIQAYDYTTEQIYEQIKALSDAGIDEYMLWDVNGAYDGKGLLDASKKN